MTLSLTVSDEVRALAPGFTYVAIEAHGLVNGPSTEAMSRNRTGGSNFAAAGRRKQWANSMPPTQRITAMTWRNCRTA